jgi:hypothetical protein
MTDGTVVVPEVKTRKKHPKWLVAAVNQARGSLAGATPIVVVSETGGEALAVVPLADFVRLVGLQSPRVRLSFRRLRRQSRGGDRRSTS